MARPRPILGTLLPGGAAAEGGVVLGMAPDQATRPIEGGYTKPSVGGGTGGVAEGGMAPANTAALARPEPGADGRSRRQLMAGGCGTRLALAGRMRPTEMAAVVYAGGGGCCASCWYSSDVWLVAAERAEAALAGRLTGRLAELRDSTEGGAGCTAAPSRDLEVLGITSRDGAMESAFAFEASGAAGMAAFMRDENGWLADGGAAGVPTANAASPGSWPPAV